MDESLNKQNNEKTFYFRATDTIHYNKKKNVAKTIRIGTALLET